MGWFNKKEESRKSEQNISLPELPKLPELPELPKLDNNKHNPKEPFHQLPSFPNNSIGKKFSQDTIKEAVKGKETNKNYSHPEEKKGERVFEANEFDFSNHGKQMMPKPLRKKQEFNFPRTEEIEEPEEDFNIEDFETEPEEDFEFNETPREKSFAKDTSYKKEPVFIRIDKFEDALKTFEKTKKEISEIEKVLKDIGVVREDEDKELQSWQRDIIKIKEQIEKVDQDIFSKIE